MRNHVSAFGRLKCAARLLSRVQVLVNRSCQLRAEAWDGFEILDTGSQHAVQASEMLQQLTPFHRTQSRHGVEHGFLVPARAPLTMAGDRESMGFVADALNEVQGG